MELVIYNKINFVFKQRASWNCFVTELLLGWGCDSAGSVLLWNYIVWTLSIVWVKKKSWYLEGWLFILKWTERKPIFWIPLVSLVLTFYPGNGQCWNKIKKKRLKYTRDGQAHKWSHRQCLVWFCLPHWSYSSVTHMSTNPLLIELINKSDTTMLFTKVINKGCYAA
jgi:hypothetical protein